MLMPGPTVYIRIRVHLFNTICCLRPLSNTHFHFDYIELYIILLKWSIPKFEFERFMQQQQQHSLCWANSKAIIIIHEIDVSKICRALRNQYSI